MSLIRMPQIWMIQLFELVQCHANVPCSNLKLMCNFWNAYKYFNCILIIMYNVVIRKQSAPALCQLASTNYNIIVKGT
jgi:hypothetical protein